jgi:Family of unknown function (DUF6350)
VFPGCARPACDSGDVAALLSSLTRRGSGDGTRRSPLLAPRWLAPLAGCAVSAAGLIGLTVAVLVVQTLDPDGGLSAGGSLGVAGRLWLLAQGGTVELDSGPLVLAPLLLTAAIAWGLVQAGRWVVRAGAVTGTGASVEAGALLLAAHVALTALLAVVLDAAVGGIGLLRVLAGTSLLGLLALAWGVGRESGVLDAGLDRLPGAVRPLLRAVLAGALTALGLCTAVVAVAVASDAAGYAALSSSLGGAGAGAVGLLALCVLLLPNAAAAVLGLAAGPGFAVGSGTLVSVHGVTLGAVPALPLFAGLPDTQAVPLLAFVSQAVPVLAGLVAGVVLGRRMSAADGGSVVAGLWGVVAGALLGVLAVAAAYAGGGALGDGALAAVGAPPLATGIAVALQTAVASALAAAVTRWRHQA